MELRRIKNGVINRHVQRENSPKQNVAPWEMSVHAGPKVHIITRSTMNIHESLHKLPGATLQSAQSPHLARQLQSLGVAPAVEE